MVFSIGNNRERPPAASVSSGSDSDAPSGGTSARAPSTGRRPAGNPGGGSTHLAAAFRSMAIAAASPGVSTDHPEVHRALRTLGGPDVSAFLPAVRAACVSGNVDEFAAVRALIVYEKVGSDQRFGDGGNMLHAIAADATHAVVRGVHVPVLERIAILAALGANPNATDQNGNTPMVIASKRNVGDVVSVVKALVAQGADVNLSGEGGNKPIHYAASRDNIPVVATLLENGARLEVLNQKCNSPMHLTATFSDNGRMIDFLVQAGHRIDIGDQHDNHPIHHAALNADSLEPLRALLRHGANINQINWHRLTPIHFHAFWATNADRVAELQTLGADFEARTDDGSTVLHEATSGKADPEVLRALIACGANPKALDDIGWTPLHTLLQNLDATNPTAAIRALVRGGADVNARGPENFTPLHVAVGFGREATVIQALVDAGAKRSSRNGYGLKAIDLIDPDEPQPDVAAILSRRRLFSLGRNG